MSGFMRPEMQKWLRRWGEPLGAGLVALVGIRLLWRGFARYDWMLELIGLAFLMIGFAAFWAAYRRSQFASGGAVPGLVPGLIDVTERRISLMTPEGGGNGGFVDIAAMTRLEIRTSIEMGRVWVLKQSEGPTLFIPLEAAGSDKLFDAFSVLPGIDPVKLIAAAKSDSDHRVVIWRGSPRFRALT